MYTFGEIAWMFLIYALVGWLWETPFVSIRNKKFVNRGFLRGPIIPIYGFAATTIMVSLRLCDDWLKIEGWGRNVFIFIFAAIVASLWEYVTSAVLEALFKTRWWDYSKMKFNLKGRIALSTSVFWGIGSTFLWLYVNNGIIAYYQSVPMEVMRTVLTVVYFAIGIDTVFTMKELISLRSLVLKLQQTSEEMVANLMEAHGAKNNIKTKVEYKKYEGFKAFNEFLDLMNSKGKEAWFDNEALNIRFNEVLEKMKSNGRLFKKYPEAKTKHFQTLFNTQKFDAFINDIKQQKKSNTSKDETNDLEQIDGRTNVENN